MNNTYNVWAKWHKLRTVVLGNCYYPEFFRDVKNTRIKSALQQISEETHEDLDNYEKVLKSFGCTVLRPKLDINESIMDHLQNGRVISVPRPPLQPRDRYIVVGKDMYYGGGDHPAIYDCVNDYNSKMIRWKDTPIQAASITSVGKDVYVDRTGVKSFADVKEHVGKMKENNPTVRFNVLNVGGHTDACFHACKPGAILSLRKIQTYENTFPGWDVCYLPNQSWNLIDGFWKMKEIVSGRWWVPGQEENKDFIMFVETWLEDWVGYCEESVFDVNVLMLDEHNVLVSNYNEQAFAFFKKHKIEPTIVPWRHRFFWDGGLHCITLDLNREGEMEDYFPDRKDPVLDEGYD